MAAVRAGPRRLRVGGNLRLQRTRAGLQRTGAGAVAGGLAGVTAFVRNRRRTGVVPSAGDVAGRWR
ncbi:hypothetical protein Sar04_06510 [Salinispora arenicola]|uniref:Uncharacterized protein n=1 Tax=Salinispora arenicola TaxID=168697 RepID=A0ABQ4JLQ0_SALAC|nr:hypothetical protein Sar04_06510 [Salinispora arenicola]